MSSAKDYGRRCVAPSGYDMLARKHLVQESFIGRSPSARSSEADSS